MSDQATPLDELYYYTFISAMEGGVNYWADIKSYKASSFPETKDQWTKFSAVIVDAEGGYGDEENNPHFVKSKGGFIVNRAIMSSGMRRVASGKMNVAPSYAQRFAEVLRNPDLAGNLDDSDADIAVQAGLFGEVIYG